MKQVLQRNIERLEKIEALLGEIRHDTEFKAYCEAQPWFKDPSKGYEDDFRKADAFVFDFTSSLEDDMEKVQ